MKRKHEMPFGAEVRDDGNVRFRLWAPKAQFVSLRLFGDAGESARQESAHHDFPMLGAPDGWYKLMTDAACSGARYQFAIDGKQAVPDPASRFQPAGVHGPSEIIDPCAYQWQNENWRGRPWQQAVIYELHVGAFTPEGTYSAAENKLDYLVDLGITAVELMPISSFPGQRNWGYDGVLPYAPTANYGRPEDLKHFIDTAHARKLMVFLDVVYNHFGPEGNYLSVYSPQFFTDRHHTPWGQAINFDGPASRAVRDYFIHNALYWLEEYRFDGLRLDAVHAIKDDSRPDILEELCAAVREKIGDERLVHLVLENDNNAARYLRDEHRVRKSGSHPAYDAHAYDAQWNDDFHHALHVLLTGEKGAYYSDYAQRPAEHLGRCLAEGFSYQGLTSQYRNGGLRGETSRDLPLSSFVNFLQNHDQVGNRALGERLSQIADPNGIRAALAILLLAPSPPLLFMGEEFGAATPFLFFCDFGPDLADKVSEGRRAEFPQFMREGTPDIPDPNSASTFLRSKLDWSSLDRQLHSDWLNFYRQLLKLRNQIIVPLAARVVPGAAQYRVLGASVLEVDWPLAGGGALKLRANLGAEDETLEKPEGRVLYSTIEEDRTIREDALPAPSAAWFLA